MTLDERIKRFVHYLLDAHRISGPVEREAREILKAMEDATKEFDEEFARDLKIRL